MKKLIITVFIMLSILSFVGCKGQTPSPEPQTPIHIHTIVMDEEHKATCTEDGLTQGSHCEVCGEVLMEQQILPATGHHHKLSSVLTQNAENTPKSGEYVCEYCGEHIQKTIAQNELGIPIVSISGSLEGISKTVKVRVGIQYESEQQQFEADATFKLQGSSSIKYDYPKKNYSIQFFEKGTENKKKVEFVEGWGKESKYVLKANYIDYSQARNVVSAKLYGQVVHSANINDEYASLVNGGAIDGFPVLVYLNDEYVGLYTLNIPKDKWLFDMDDDDEKRQAIVMGDRYTNSTRLDAPMSYDFASSGWDLEFASTEENATIGTNWVVDSFNTMMDFVNANDGEAFKQGISQYINVPRSIDSMLFTWIINGEDNFQHNLLWTTYNGTQWSTSVYDMDGTWGLNWNGQEITPADELNLFIMDMTIPNDYYGYLEYTNILWGKFYQNYFDEIKARYLELRANVLSTQNIHNEFNAFFDKIPSMLFESDSVKYTEVPNQALNNQQNICDWVTLRMQTIDAFFAQN